MASDREFENMSDEAIVHCAKTDAAAAQFLLQKYKKLVRAKAAAYYLIGADREDLIQEGMLGLFKAVRDFVPGKAGFYSFAELCITRQIISAVKAATRQKHRPLNQAVSLQSTTDESQQPLEQRLTSKESNDPQEMFLEKLRQDSLQHTMDTVLSRFEKRVLEGYLAGLSYAQIAAQVERSEKSVDNALQRIKQKLAGHRP